MTAKTTSPAGATAASNAGHLNIEGFTDDFRVAVPAKAAAARVAAFEAVVRTAYGAPVHLWCTNTNERGQHVGAALKRPARNWSR